jgi:hypothetical protein
MLLDSNMSLGELSLPPGFNQPINFGEPVISQAAWKLPHKLHMFSSSIFSSLPQRPDSGSQLEAILPPRGIR